MRTLLAASFAAFLAGCAAQPPAVTERSAASHDQPVCLLKTAMPASVKHRVVGTVESSKEWYGSQTELYPMLADEARKVGADVVAGMTTAHRIGMFAWARPVGSGSAVKLESRKDLNCAAWGGELR
jgi:hypothetical protein